MIFDNACKGLLPAILLTLGSLSQAAENPVLEREFQTFLEWFPGTYDNQEQVYFEGELDVPEDERHERIHHTFAPVDLPAFGEHVFYVQQYLNDDPTQIYRQRIYSFTIDEAEDAIRLAIYTPDDATHRPGCDVFWKMQANQFAGYMKERACTFVSQRSGKTIVIDDDLVLTDSEIWISDRAEDEDGNYVFGNKAGIPHKNIKARRFECWIAARERDEENWTFKSGLEVWDQGGTIWIDTEEDQSQTVGIKLRNVQWPTGTNRNSFVLYAYRQGDERAVSYVWGEPEATRLAMNLRWMQASCTHAPQ